jgi:hypothetical protein
MLARVTAISGLVLLMQGVLLGSGVTADVNGVRVENASLTKTDKTLEVSYRIKNDSGEDIWLCEAILHPLSDYEVYLAQDKRTLMIRRRFDKEVAAGWQWLTAPVGYYVRLREGESRSELMILPWPVWSATVFATDSVKGQDVLNAERLVVEIGFYGKDLLPKAFRARDEDNRIGVGLPAVSQPPQILTVAFDNQGIPYVPQPTVRDYAKPPVLRECKQIEVHFRPSMLEYFYPDSAQQALLDASEKKYLRSQQSTTLKDARAILDLHEDVQQGWGAFVVCSGPTAQMVCHDKDKGTRTYTFYADRVLAIKDEGTRQYEHGVPAMRKVTPQIKRIEPRIQCAANLTQLMDRVRWHDIQAKARQSTGASKESEWVYPPPDRWCDTIVQQWSWMKPEGILPLLKCPGKNDGKCNYAMNPNCEPNSPPETVLFFETKAGWNQHGGRELFTFDNHDPKGGCVLLNDGTVKFIRTKKELSQLRWGENRGR